MRHNLKKMQEVRIAGNRQVPIVLRSIFAHYDQDQSGSITEKEMQELVLELFSLLPGTPKHLVHCSKAVAKIAMSALDLDGGGTIDEDEFTDWCQANLFMSPADRQAMLINNMDLSQFITALEMCVKMQLAGVGPYADVTSYRPPPPTCKEKWCTQKCCVVSCLIFWLVLIGSGIPIFIFVLLPILPKKEKKTKKATPAPAPAGAGGAGGGGGGNLTSTPSASGTRRLIRLGDFPLLEEVLPRTGRADGFFDGTASRGPERPVSSLRGEPLVSARHGVHWTEWDNNWEERGALNSKHLRDDAAP